MDIVDKNTNSIKSILWRVMRYQSIKILSDLQFGSNVNKVNNAEIVKWCNQKLAETLGANIRCKQIKKLNDSSLTTGLYYLELIRAIMPNAINDDFVNLNVAPITSSIKKDFNLHDKHYKKRKENLKYSMTIIRRFGVDLFINVEDLFRLESRAVLSILAAVMTISLSQKHIKEEGEEQEQENKDKQDLFIQYDKIEDDEQQNNQKEHEQEQDEQNYDDNIPTSKKDKNVSPTPKKIKNDTPKKIKNKKDDKKMKSKKGKKGKDRQNKKKKKGAKSQLNMDNMNYIDVDSVLDSVDSLYKK